VTIPPDRTHDFASRCARCGTAFVCGVDEPGGCWCARLPRLPATALEADDGCLCEACLQRALAAATPPC
jgi:hypothetical protein